MMEPLRWPHIYRTYAGQRAVQSHVTWPNVYNTERERERRKMLTSNSFVLFKVLMWKEMFSHTYVAVTSLVRLAPEATLGAFWRASQSRMLEQIKRPMADFHLGQHLLFRKHAYTVTCHPAPGAVRRPTLPLRDGPPFCCFFFENDLHAWD